MMTGLCELGTKPKLAFVQLLQEKGGQSWCLDMARKRYW